MKRILAQLQLSNYDTSGVFILECDSGFQMVFGRLREMLRAVPDLIVDVLGPRRSRLRTQPEDIVPEVFASGRVRWIEIDIIPNALATRYDFMLEQVCNNLSLRDHKTSTDIRYDGVYVNDPFHLRNFKALFHLYAGYQPKFWVHSHFVDDPSCPKFPVDASLWLGQVEAAIKADWNFWQCESAMNIFFEEMGKTYLPHVVNNVKAKSTPWDDGYSIDEVRSPINVSNIRFDIASVKQQLKNKVVLFVPNRIGGRGRSSDYTNCGKFMFDILPELRKLRTGKGLAFNHDFVVIAGNPSQKFFNHELEKECGQNGFLNLVPDAFNRDEFKWVASHSDIAVGLYNQDSYGGTAARECIELGCVPLWLNNYEYATIAKFANWPYVARPDMVDLVSMTDALIECVKSKYHLGWLDQLQTIVRNRCSYESTTPCALKIMNLV
jgi:hypothetical protein